MDENIKRAVRSPFIISFTISHATFVLPAAYSAFLFVSPMSAHLFRLITPEKWYEQFFFIVPFSMTVETFSFFLRGIAIVGSAFVAWIWHQWDENSPQEIDFNNSITTNNNSKHDKIVWCDNPAKWVTDNGNSVAFFFALPPLPPPSPILISDMINKNRLKLKRQGHNNQPIRENSFFLLCRVFHCLVAHIQRQNLRLLSIFLCCVSALFLMLCVTQ